MPKYAGALLFFQIKENTQKFHSVYARTLQPSSHLGPKKELKAIHGASLFDSTDPIKSGFNLTK